MIFHSFLDIMFSVAQLLQKGFIFLIFVVFYLKFLFFDHSLQANLTNANLEGAVTTGNTSFKGSIITGAGRASKIIGTMCTTY